MKKFVYSDRHLLEHLAYILFKLDHRSASTDLLNYTVRLNMSLRYNELNINADAIILLFSEGNLYIVCVIKIFD